MEKNLHMHKSTFDYLCKELQPYIARQCTVLREPVSVEERVAVTLWRLATNAEYRTLASLFGLGTSTVCTVVLDTCHAITKLLHRYVSIPQGDHLQDRVNGFEAHWGFPQAAGTIDATHIHVLRPPEESGNTYYNRKSFYPILMQVLLDHKGILLDIDVGWPGKVDDAQIFFKLHTLC